MKVRQSCHSPVYLHLWAFLFGFSFVVNSDDGDSFLPRVKLLLSVGVTTTTITLEAGIHLETEIEAWKSSHISLSCMDCLHNVRCTGGSMFVHLLLYHLIMVSP